MKDRDFLIWIHERLEYIHDESDLLDYMHKLRAIILNTPADKESVPKCCNSMSDLKKELGYGN